MSFPGVRGLLLALATAFTVPAGAHDDTLYERLGAAPGTAAIVDRFLFHLADNERALPLFLNTDIERFREKFREHLCEVSDGPCRYSGDSMTATHRGMRITRAQFNSVVENLVDALEDLRVPVAAQNDLLERLAAFYPEITGH